MKDLWRRIGISFVIGAMILPGYTLVYRWVMATFEGEFLSLMRAFRSFSKR